MAVQTHNLDADQCIKEVYDQSINRLRVDAEVHADVGDLEVSISAADGDNIAIVDTDGDELEVNADGSINVVISDTQTQTTSNVYTEISSLASGSETIITTFTAPAGGQVFLVRAEATGENIARYRVFRNGAPIAKKFTYFSGDLSADFDFSIDNFHAPGLELTAGDVITVRVLHNRPNVGDFAARILTVQIV